MISPHRRLVVSWLLLCLALASSLAAALPWYARYEEGLQLAEDGSWEAALEAFESAAREAPQAKERARTYGNRFLFGYDPHFQAARCLIELGRPEEALAALERSVAQGVTPEDRIRSLRLQAEKLASLPPPGSPVEKDAPVESTALEPSPPPSRLVVRSRPTGARVWIDDRPRGVTPLETILPKPGQLNIRLEAAGYQRWEQSAEARGGETLRLEVTLTPSAPPAPSADGNAEGEETLLAETEAPSPAEETAPPPAGRDEPFVEPPEVSVPTAEAGKMPASSSADEPPFVDSRPLPPPSSRSRHRPLTLLGALGAVVAIGLLVGVLILRRKEAARRTSLPFRQLGSYRIVSELGRGGMAITYLARRKGDGREVALKVPFPSTDERDRERFLREGRLGESLHHPGIVEILEAGEDRSVPFLALELIPGRTLRQELDAHPEGLPAPELLRIVEEIAEALDYAHAKGVVHRDLKPENVMILPDGHVKVMDFGVARVAGDPGLTGSRIVLGSPLYTAPEAVTGEPLDARADLYSLGILLFELLQGRPPFVDASVFRVLERHQREPLPAADSLERSVSPELWSIVERLCAKDPAERYPDCASLLVALQRLRGDFPVPSLPAR